MKRRDLLRLPLVAGKGAALGAFRGPGTPPGSTPGTLPSHPDARPPRVSVIAYGPHELTEFDVEDLEQLTLLRGRYPVLWVNVDGVRHSPTVQRIGDIFCLHRLALEDVGHIGQQTKSEVFADHIFLVARMVRLVPGLDLEQVSLFVGSDYVVSFQERPGDPLDPVRTRLRGARGRIRAAGPDYLAYAILDAVVDHCFPVVEAYAERLDELEMDVLGNPGRETINHLHGVRRDLVALRRAVWPLREALASLVREPPAGLVDPGTVVYLRDVQDHLVQIVDLVEGCRELGSSLTDLYLSSVGNRTNEIMKVLTIFAALFIPLGFITGLYGMNVVNTPSWLRSLTVAEATMAAVTLGLLFFFWRRGWLGGSH
ncbi:MAG TPA: magnesium/cobalt transporter CorA [Longimicrobium sp.]|jgi:magnesium transporter